MTLIYVVDYSSFQPFIVVVDRDSEADMLVTEDVICVT